MVSPNAGLAQPGRAVVPGWSPYMATETGFRPAHFVPKNTPSAPSPWKVGQTLGSWVFEFWLPKNTPHPKNEKLARSWDFEYPRIPLPPTNSWSLWRLTAVSSKDTVLFSFVFAEPLVCGKLYVYVTVPLGLWMIQGTRRFITEPQQVDFNILY